MATLSVAVIGSRPAGATAARILAGQGAHVTVLEARRRPRRKTCCGALTPQAQRLVPPGVLGVVERRVRKVEVRGGRLSPVHLDAPEAEIAMVRRSRFDLAMAEAAAAAGADIRDGEHVSALVEDARGVHVETQRDRFRADVVVVADGEPSTVARRLGLGSRAVRHSLALDLDVPLAEGQPRDTAILSLTVPGGYAWYFPKGDHANVGAVSDISSSGVGVAVMPRQGARVGLGSASMAVTLKPRRISSAAASAATVVFPAPPLPETAIFIA